MQSALKKHDTLPAARLKPLPEEYIKSRPASDFLYEGEKRILIEMESIEGTRLCEVLQAYEKLVDYISNTIADDPLFYPDVPESFLAVCPAVLRETIKIGGSQRMKGFLFNAVKTNRFDCDNSAFLVFDVVKKLGIGLEPEIVITPRHTLLKLGKSFYETTDGKILQASEFYGKYAGGQTQISSDSGIIQSISVDNRAAARLRPGNSGLDAAIRDYSKAIELSPNTGSIYYNRGLCSHGQGNLEAAIQDYSRAVALDPQDADSYFNRALAYGRQGKLNESARDFIKARELDPHNRQTPKMLKILEDMNVVVPA